MPFTEPLPGSTVATAVLLLLHVPPVIASVSGDEEPEQMPNVPLIGPGRGFTVTIAVILQPAGVV